MEQNNATANSIPVLWSLDVVNPFVHDSQHPHLKTLTLMILTTRNA